jgi:GntR family transcriptional regulator/MocR family aminotransferase
VGNGAYGDPAGHDGLRRAIARPLGVARGVLAAAEDVVVTNGTQQAVDVVARVLLEPGDRVAVEAPGYGPPRRLLASLGMDVAGVPVDAEGLVVEAIPPGTRMVLVTPSHQFPPGHGHVPAAPPGPAGGVYAERHRRIVEGLRRLREAVDRH